MAERPPAPLSVGKQQELQQRLADHAANPVMSSHGNKSRPRRARGSASESAPRLPSGGSQRVR
jgi:hypothetical protein